MGPMQGEKRQAEKSLTLWQSSSHGLLREQELVPLSPVVMSFPPPALKEITAMYSCAGGSLHKGV